MWDRAGRIERDLLKLPPAELLKLIDEYEARPRPVQRQYEIPKAEAARAARMTDEDIPF